MVLVPTTFGENVQQPYSGAEVFIPDQLIAGSLKLVTDDFAVVTGSAVLQRGSVMGLTSFGSIAATAGKLFATGTILIAALPAAADTLTIQGTVITFAAQPTPYTAPVGNQVFIGATTAATAQALLAFLVGSTDVNLSKLNYSLSGSTITANANIPGTGGNAYTLATSDSTAFTLSGATLASGTNNTGTATVGSISAGASVKAGNYSVVLTSATVGNVFDPTGEELGQTTMGTAFVNPQINFTITTGGSPAVGDAFVLAAAPGAAGVYRLCTATAVDGSEKPAGILVDYTDPTAGNVTAGVYVMGEFNGNALVLDPSLSLQLSLIHI